jgi:hypothetical protein
LHGFDGMIWHVMSNPLRFSIPFNRKATILAAAFGPFAA